jgi:hypothetical protein
LLHDFVAKQLEAVLALRMRSAYETDHKPQVRRAQYSALVTSQSALALRFGSAPKPAHKYRRTNRPNETDHEEKKPPSFPSFPPMIAAVIAAVCLIILAGLVYQRPGNPSDETMFSAARTDSLRLRVPLSRQLSPGDSIASSGPLGESHLLSSSA